MSDGADVVGRSRITTDADRTVCRVHVTVGCPSVCPVDRQQRRSAGLLLSSGSIYRSTAAAAAAYRLSAARAPAVGSATLIAEVRGST